MSLLHTTRRSLAPAALGTSLLLLGGLASLVPAARAQGTSLESPPTNAKVYHTRFKADPTADIREVAIEGAVRFSPDESRITWLGDGAYVRIIVQENGRKLRFDATADGQGHPAFAYEVDGRPRPYDENAAGKLAAVLPAVFRELGHGEVDRVRATYHQSGVDGVLGLIAGIHSEYSIGLHASAFFGLAGLSDDEISRCFALLGRHFSSDAERAAILYRASDLYRERPGVRQAFLACLEGFQSEIEKTRATQNLFGVSSFEAGEQPDMTMLAGC